MIGDTYKRVNAEFECLAVSLDVSGGRSVLLGGDCVLGASKAPMIFRDTAHELCHIRARLDYLEAFLECLKEPDPGKCCEQAYANYCTAAVACDVC